MRWIWSIVVVLSVAGCPSSKSTPAGGSGAGGPTTGRNGPRVPVGSNAKNGIGFAPCPTGPCMYHRGAAAYHHCLSASGGVCFHYGRACAPADSCMFDAASRTHRTCAQLGDGQCEKFGAACAPKDKCMVDPADGVYRTCDSPTSGGCQKFGAACLPR